MKWAVSVIWCVLIKLSYKINLIRLFHFTRTFKHWKQVVNQWSHKLVYKTTSDFWRHLGLSGESVVDVSVKKLVWQPVLTLQPLWSQSALQGGKNNWICSATASEALQIPLAVHCRGPYSLNKKTKIIYLLVWHPHWLK